MLFEKQQFQEDCVKSIIHVLDKTDMHHNDFSNLKVAISELNKANKQTQFITCNRNKIDILMETGTGKTFTYLKTIFEINKQYGKTKFMIVVPRNAIKAGVIQNIELTKEYFFNEYQKHLNIIEYPKDGLSKIEQDFLTNNQKFTVLIITNSAFSKKDNLINQIPEHGNLFRNGTIWQNIAKQNPVIIIDEPHLLQGEKTKEYLDKLDNSLLIRFGATYPNDKNDKKLTDADRLSNVVYALDSITSFNQYLVKKISVHTLLFQSETGDYILSGIQSKKKQFSLSYFQNQDYFKTDIALNQDIGVKTNIDSLKGVSATKITADSVYLSNQTELKINHNFKLSDDEITLMIKATIEKHFEKEEILFNQGIKALSLFFIPNVADFRGDKATIKNIFENLYKKIRNKVYQETNNQAYKDYLDKDFDKNNGALNVHQGYFSGDKGKTQDDKDTAGINEILHEKKKLLSFESPLRFIFSVWALQEGWDNPNIFNICKLSNTAKDTSRRQQVGRGLRIAVNQAGKRQTFNHLNQSEADFYEINTLHMFVSHYELDFIKHIQTEIEQASFCLVGNIIDAQLLKDKGLTEREANKFINILDDEKIISYSEATNTYTINTSIYEFLCNHSEKISFLDANRLNELKAIFKNNKISVENGNKTPEKIKIRANKLEEFKQLWQSINRKSKIVYQNIQQDNLIKEIAKKFNQEIIEPIQIKMTEQLYHSHTNQIEKKQETILSNKVKFFTNTNLNNQYQDFINAFTKDEKLKLPLVFVMQLLNQLDVQKIKNNPKKAKERLKAMIMDCIHDSLIQTIDYKFENEINITSLHDKNSKNSKDYLQEINHTLIGKYIADTEPKEASLFDKIIYDSTIEKEIQTNDPMQINTSKITVFAKLPKISIPTPYKNYNPDFAYLIDRPNNKKLFLIVEAKGYQSHNDIPDDEQKKIEYAKIFFEKLQQQIPDVEIAFKTRINQQDLSQLLTTIEQGNA